MVPYWEAGQIRIEAGQNLQYIWSFGGTVQSLSGSRVFSGWNSTAICGPISRLNLMGVHLVTQRKLLMQEKEEMDYKDSEREKNIVWALGQVK